MSLNIHIKNIASKPLSEIKPSEFWGMDIEETFNDINNLKLPVNIQKIAHKLIHMQSSISIQEASSLLKELCPQ